MSTLTNIKEIYIGKNKRNDYLVIEDENYNIVLNMTTGKEENNMNLSLNHITYIYNSESEYKEKIELENIIRVEFISNVELINKYTNKNVSSPFLVCLLDKKGNKLYIDVVLNIAYTRKNHYKLKKYSNTNIRELFTLNKQNKVFYQKLLIKFCKKLKPIIAIDEENEV